MYERFRNKTFRQGQLSSLQIKISMLVSLAEKWFWSEKVGT